MVAETEKHREVRRILERYLVEVVETYGFCPWARSARTGGEVGATILFGQPTLDEWVTAALATVRRPGVKVAMIVAPELAVGPAEFREIREQVARRADGAGVADFHPDGAFDASTAPRLVPFVRRSPDPLLQLLPLAMLDEVRTQTAPPTLSEQALLLGGIAHTGTQDIADRIAETNHARVVRDRAAIDAALADIAADRRRSYARVGITISTSR